MNIINLELSLWPCSYYHLQTSHAVFSLTSSPGTCLFDGSPAVKHCVSPEPSQKYEHSGHSLQRECDVSINALDEVNDLPSVIIVSSILSVFHIGCPEEIKKMGVGLVCICK